MIFKQEDGRKQLAFPEGRRRLSVGLISLFLCGLAPAGKLPELGSQVQVERQSKPNPANALSPKSMFRLERESYDSRHHDIDEDHEDSRIKWTDKAVAISATLSAFFSLILTVSTIMLWLSTRRLWRGAEAQAVHVESSAKAAASAAEAAERSVDAYRNAERAWLGVSQINVSQMVGKIDGELTNDGIVFFARVINIGRTPAMEVILRIDHRIVPRAHAVTPFVNEATEESLTRSPIMPGMTVSSAIRALNDEESSAFRDGRVKILLYVSIIYKDALSGNVPRVTEVCMRGECNGVNQNTLTGVITPNYNWQTVGLQNRAT